MKRNIFLKITSKSKIINLKALQAQGNNLIILKHIFSYFCFNQRVSLRLPVKGIISIEAAVAIPVFMFCFLEIMSVLNYLSLYGTMLVSLKGIGDKLSVYGCAYDELLFQEELTIGEEVISAYVFSEMYLDAQLQKRIREDNYDDIIVNGVNGINLFGSHINAQNNTLLLSADYTVKPIVGIAGIFLDMNTSYYVRLWTGYESSHSFQEEFVYVTDTASVYHLFDDCTHLKLSIQLIDEDELSMARNEYGSSYSACTLCADVGEMYFKYYITSQGERYHYKASCSGLKRTIHCVEINQVDGLQVCSRCRRRREESS